MSFFWIVCGASLGALTRFGFQTFAAKYTYPIGTLVANLMGCFLIGLAYSYSSQMSQEMRVGVMTGFLGALTTMSSFTLDLVKMMEQKEWVSTLSLTLLTLLGGLALTVFGVYLGQKLNS